MIYVPTEYLNYSCKVVNNGYIRVYTNSTNTNWVDIYINQDYMIKEGYSNYSQNVVCDSVNQYTDNFYYRIDFPSILIMFVIFVIFTCYIPYKIFMLLFRRAK